MVTSHYNFVSLLIHTIIPPSFPLPQTFTLLELLIKPPIIPTILSKNLFIHLINGPMN